jgi:hypothetical protein
VVRARLPDGHGASRIAPSITLVGRFKQRLEIVEHLRLTKAAMGSARAVSEDITRFGTVAEDVGKTRAACAMKKSACGVR